MFKNRNGFENNQEAQVPSPRAADPVGLPSLSLLPATLHLQQG